jgi:hypothetical protein
MGNRFTFGNKGIKRERNQQQKQQYYNEISKDILCNEIRSELKRSKKKAAHPKEN